jgi:hypothetical protein
MSHLIRQCCGVTPRKNEIPSSTAAKIKKKKIFSTFAVLTRKPDHVDTNSVTEKKFDSSEYNCGKFIFGV